MKLGIPRQTPESKIRRSGLLNKIRLPSAFLKEGYLMTKTSEFRCEVCGRVTITPVHWFVIQCNSDELKLMKWNAEAAAAKEARHYCGEAHAQVYISRWLEAACSPPISDFVQQ